MNHKVFHNPADYNLKTFFKSCMSRKLNNIFKIGGDRKSIFFVLRAIIRNH
jgi:hypothetical protein